MRRSAIALALLIAFGLPLAAQSERRHALVIGNGSYTELGRLTNPANDARDMAAALRELGFEVKLLIDADLASMEDAVIRLSQSLSQSPDSVGFFFYAGHGVQSGGINYLIPADAKIGAEMFLKTKALAAQSVLEGLQQARNALNVVVLDACRDNPFSWGRGGSRGLTVVSNQPPGSIIAYATSAGSVAQDGSGRNGVFTAELLSNLKTQGLEIKDVFNRTGKAVTTATAGKQVPAVYNQFFDEAYLAGRTSSDRLPPQAQTVPSVPAPSVSYAQPSTPSTAELVVSTDQEGAEIYVDGTRLGTAPNLFSGILAGREILVEAKKGPYSASERLSMKPGETREVSFSLELGKGNLFFQVPNASSYRLWLDGEEWGTLSAAGFAKEIPAGEREAELRGEGMHWKGLIEVKVGSSTTVKASPWEVGTVLVELPSDASFRLSQQAPEGGASPIVQSSRGTERYELLPAGRYSFEAWGPGYESHSSTVNLGKGEDKRVEPWTTGSLVVSSDPPGGAVTVGGRPQGQTPLMLSDLGPGYVEITVKREGYEDVSQQKRIEAGKTTEAAFILRKKPEQALPPAGSAVAVGAFVRIPAGTFTMGSNSSEKNQASNEGPLHTVIISDFSIGQYEVTQGEWQVLMGSNPSSFKGDDRLPVEGVSLYDILVYCNKRSLKEGLTTCYSIGGSTDPVRWGPVPTSSNSTWNAARCDFSANGYRLPTEAEWEYACRAGTTTATAFGNTLVSSQANFNGNSQYNVSTKGAYLQKTTKVGSYAPNAWGLYDMHGNVWEWCWDWYAPYVNRKQTDPQGASSGTYRVTRGGSWYNDGNYLRSAKRNLSLPDGRYSNYGFRVVVGR